MDTQDEKEFRFHDLRIQEFEDLLGQAKSQTLIDLINKAKNYTDSSLELLVQIQGATVKYLKAYEIKNNEKRKEIEKCLAVFNEKIIELKGLILPDEIRTQIQDFYMKMLTDLEGKIKIEADVYELTYKTFIFCANEFKRMLLQLIFKPASGAFHYETLIDILNYFLTKYIPGLGEFKTMSNFPVEVRKKQFAKNGDKILIYFEQYIDVLEKWEILGNAYLKIVND